MSSYSTHHAPQPYPTFVRVSTGQLLRGVCTGLSVHLGIKVLWVRIFFALLGLFPAVGIIVYATLMALSKRYEMDPAHPDVEPPRPDAASWALLALNIVLTLASFGMNLSPLLVIAVLAVLGGLLMWFTVGTKDAKISTPHPSAVQWMSMIGGVVLLSISAGFAVFQSLNGEAFAPDSTMISLSMLAGGVFLLGCVVVFIPLWLRLWSVATQSQRAEARAEERAVIASRIHDSVLQTLTLIQKKSEEPEITRLARSQERQLRQWLFGAHESASTETVFGAMRVACGEVEDTFGIELRPVFAGNDFSMTEATLEVVMAARESMVNAAKHSGCAEANVFVEADEQNLTIFVRDRGPGFDVDSIPQDRFGVRKSVLDRVTRAGGTVDIDSGDFGTEVTLTLPRDERTA